MRNITGTLLTATGVAAANIKISFALVDANQKPTSSFIAATSERVYGLFTTTTDINGAFTIGLTENTLLVDETYYFVRTDMVGDIPFVAGINEGDGTALDWFELKTGGVPVTPAELNLLQNALDNLQTTTDDMYVKLDLVGLVERSRLTPEPSSSDLIYVDATNAVYNLNAQDVKNGQHVYRYSTTNIIKKYTLTGTTSLPTITQVGTGTLVYSSNAIGAPAFHQLSIPDTVFYLHCENGDPFIRLMKSVNGGAWAEVYSIDATGWSVTTTQPYLSINNAQVAVIDDIMYLIRDASEGQGILKVDMTNETIAFDPFVLTPQFGIIGAVSKMTSIGDTLYYLTYVSTTSIYLNTYNITTTAETSTLISNPDDAYENALYGFYYNEPDDAFYLRGYQNGIIANTRIYRIDRQTSTMTAVVDISAQGNSNVIDAHSVILGNTFVTQPEGSANVYGASLLLNYSTFYVTKAMTIEVDNNAKNSTALGEHTLVERENGSAFGEFNVGYTGTLLEIGIGTSDIARLNGFEVYETGDVQAPNRLAVPNPFSLLTKDIADTLYNKYAPTGANGTFTTVDGKTATVTDGLITALV